MTVSVQPADALTGSPWISPATLEQLLRSLVRIRSTNPGAGESALATWVAGWLERETAAEVHLLETLSERHSVAAVIGSGTGPRVVLNGHLDTVPVDDLSRWSVDPFAGEVRDGYLYGRGACDMKAGLAVQLAVAALLSRAGREPRGRLVLHFAVGEENAEPGTSSLLAAGFTGDVGVVGEPTGLDIAIATRGLLHAEVRLIGRSGHASRPDLAANPLDALPAVFETVRRYEAEVRGRRHPLLPAGSCTPTIVRAGVKANATPDECCIVLDCRLLPGESIVQELESLQRRFEGIGAGEGLEIEVSAVTDGFEPAEVDAGCDLVRRLSRAVTAASGREPRLVGTPYASDVSRLIVEAGMEAVTFGAGNIAECHCADERVLLAQVREAALALGLLVSDLIL